jgi:hypothetical protein
VKNVPDYLMGILEQKGLKKIRGVHVRETHLFIFRGKGGEIFLFHEALNPKTSRVLTRIDATHPSAEHYIREADHLFNESRKLSYINTK